MLKVKGASYNQINKVTNKGDKTSVHQEQSMIDQSNNQPIFINVNKSAIPTNSKLIKAAKNQLELFFNPELTIMFSHKMLIFITMANI